MSVNNRRFTEEEIRNIYIWTAPRLTEILCEFVSEIEKLFNSQNICITYKSRIKGFESFCGKAENRADMGSDPLSNVQDFMGVRLICPFLQDVDMVEKAILAVYNVAEVERKGEEFNYREFGYQSRHINVILPKKYGIEGYAGNLYCEIQVRTLLQNAWAEVEHELVYKNGDRHDDKILRHKMAALNASLSLADIVFQEIRDNSRSDEDPRSYT